jgi:hypothetical protein
MLRGLEELRILIEDIEHGRKVQTQGAGIALALAPPNLLHLVSIGENLIFYSNLMRKLLNGYLSINL